MPVEPKPPRDGELNGEPLGLPCCYCVCGNVRTLIGVDTPDIEHPQRRAILEEIRSRSEGVEINTAGHCGDLVVGYSVRPPRPILDILTAYQKGVSAG